jgi:SAM-dependent methyltransferase
MLDRGAQVTAIEPGEQLAARLARNTAGRPCRIVRARFEEVGDAELDAPYDLAAAATSFHWLDAAVAVPRVADVLRPAGHLAVWWNVHRGLADEDDPIHEALDPIHARFQTRSRRSSTTHAFDHDARVAELEAGGRFEVVAHERIEWPWTHDAASLRDLYASFSDWLTVPEPDRTHALDAIAATVDDRFGGRVTRSYSTVLFVARRR